HRGARQALQGRGPGGRTVPAGGRVPARPASGPGRGGRRGAPASAGLVISLEPSTGAIMRSFAAIAAGSVLVALVGCRGPTHRQVDASEPGLIDVDNIGLNEIRPAVEAMLTKVSKMNLEGWAGHILLTEDSPKRPQVRIAGV